MTIQLTPETNQDDWIDFPNGFWPAVFCETPAAEVFESYYKPGTNEMTIVYEHEGYIGGLVNQEDAKAIHSLLSAYVLTDDYKKHRYFSSRSNQMDSFLEFLPHCGGFKAS